MIFGVGTDIVRIDRVAAVHQRFGQRFVERLLMPEELAQFGRSGNQVRFLAMRFAAKEALVKAMGTGFGHGVWIRDVGVQHNAWGRPDAIFSQRGLQVCDKLGIGRGYVSMSDEDGMALAFAVMECR